MTVTFGLTVHVRACMYVCMYALQGPPSAVFTPSAHNCNLLRSRSGGRADIGVVEDKDLADQHQRVLLNGWHNTDRGEWSRWCGGARSVIEGLLCDVLGNRPQRNSDAPH